MSESNTAAAPATPAPVPTTGEGGAAAPVPTQDVGATATGSAEPAPSPSPLEQSILDLPTADAEAPKEAAPAEPIDPASYEVKLPEGMTREDPMVSNFLASAAELGLKGDAVQTVLDKMAPLVAEQLAAPMKAWTDLNNAWQAEIKADPEVGGTKLTASVATITSVIDRFGTPELKDALRMTGAVNNPHIFRFLHKLSAAYTEATPVAAGNSGFVAPPGRALAAMYPSARQEAGAA
jgi:hypothetical protein